MSKQPPTRTYCKCSRPLPYCNPNCRTPQHQKFTQHHRTTRPPPLGKEHCRKSPGSPEMFSTSVMRGVWKKMRYEAGVKEYREANKRIHKAMKKAKENWIFHQCKKVKTCLNKNNIKTAYQLMKDLPSEKQGRSTTIQDR